jgi:hypothetical protein
MRVHLLCEAEAQHVYPMHYADLMSDPFIHRLIQKDAKRAMEHRRTTRWNEGVLVGVIDALRLSFIEAGSHKNRTVI